MSPLEELSLTDSVVIKALKARAQERVKVDYTRQSTHSELHNDVFPLDTIVKYKLYKGSRHTATVWNEAVTSALYQESVNRAFRLIAQKQRTEQELRLLIKTTKRYNFTEDMINTAVKRVDMLGYLNESSTAKAHVTRTRARLKSSRKLKQELHARGVSNTAADEVLESHSDLNAAQEVAQKKAARLIKHDQPTAKLRLYRYLVQQGFPYDLSRQLADQHFSTSLTS